MGDGVKMKTAYYGFTGIIDSGSVTRITSAFNLAVNNGYEEICMCLSSTGGFIADGIYLYNHIRSLPIKAIFHNTGTVASIATAVYVGAEERYCSEHGIFLIHPTEMPAQEYMRAERLQANLTAALAEDKRTEDILRQRATIPETSWPLDVSTMFTSLRRMRSNSVSRTVSANLRSRGERNTSNLTS